MSWLSFMHGKGHAHYESEEAKRKYAEQLLSLSEKIFLLMLAPFLQDVRDVRNISAHLAQKIDQIVSLNSSVLGSISWVSLRSAAPLKMKTYFIRPGIMRGNMKGQFAMPRGKVSFCHGSGYISVAAGKHDANLSLAYRAICSIIEFAEDNLKRAFQDPSFEQRLPTNIFGSAELDTGGA